MDILNRHFGQLIAYVLPGFIALAGIAPLVPTVAGWLYADQAAGFAAPVYSLLAATAAGMVVSCFRWLTVDNVHAMTGLPTPSFNAQAVEKSSVTFNLLVEAHYRFHQFYGNTLISVIWVFAVHQIIGPAPHVRIAEDLGVFILCAALFTGSRDALNKYRIRVRQLDPQISTTIELER